MIIDSHTHLPTHEGMVPAGEVKVDSVMRSGVISRLTKTMDEYLQDMKVVDRCIVFGIAEKPGTPRILEELQPKGNPNDMAAVVAAHSGGKAIGFMSVHPEDPKVMDEMERCVHDLKLKGIKLGPNYQVFDPLGKPAKKVFAFAQKNHLPIVFHQGTSPVRNAPLRYAHPLLMDEVAMEFPELRVVMAHVGHPWHEDCLMVIRKHPHVYADISGQFLRPWSYYKVMRMAFEWGVTNKLFFASDWPIMSPAETMDALHGFNKFSKEYHLPEVPDDLLEAIINRDSLPLLGLA